MVSLYFGPIKMVGSLGVKENPRAAIRGEGERMVHHLHLGLPGRFRLIGASEHDRGPQ